MTTIDTTVFKTFGNFSHLVKLTANMKWYVELSNGYCVPVLKSALKRVAESMAKNNESFMGKITFSNAGWVQIFLAKPD